MFTGVCDRVWKTIKEANSEEVIGELTKKINSLYSELEKIWHSKRLFNLDWTLAENKQLWQ